MPVNSTRGLSTRGLSALGSARELDLDGSGRRTPFRPAGVGSLLRHQLGREAKLRPRGGLAPAVDGGVNWAWAEAPVVTNINVAVSIDFITNLPCIDLGSIKHICLVGNNGQRVQQ
jgi:hypothetical protein